MSIVHVHGNHVDGLTEGVSRNVDSLVRVLRDQGEDARLASRTTALEAMNRRRNLLLGTLRARHLAAQALADPRTDVVHCHVSLPSLALLTRLVRPRRKPLVVHAWNATFDPDCTPHAPGRRLHQVANSPQAARLALRGAEDVVVSSRHQALQLEALGVASRVHRIPNGVDAALFRPATAAQRQTARATYGLGPGPVVLYYGHASPWKGLDVLLHAWPDVVRSHPQATLLLSVTGYGGGAARVQDKVHRLGIQASTVVTGPSHVPTLHAAADVAVLPLRAAVGTACHPNVLLESMAAGLPVVATEVGSVPEVVRHGRNGLLVPPDDAGLLADALCGLVESPLRRAALGRYARQSMVSAHSWASAAQALRRLYQGLGVPAAPRPSLRLLAPTLESAP